jgi:Zn-finger nucleic acid-binding protein
MISCPRCRGTLQEEDSQGVRIDVCQSCKGIWLDGSELQTLLRGIRGDVSQGPPPEITVPETSGNMHCPRCTVKLVAFEYAGDSSIELDRCPECAGLWLDAGERETIERKVAVARWKPHSKSDRKMKFEEKAFGWIQVIMQELSRTVRQG